MAFLSQRGPSGPASIPSLGNPSRDDGLSLPCHQAQLQRGPEPNNLLIGTCYTDGRARVKQQPCHQWGWQCIATSDRGVSPNLLMTPPPPTLSKTAQGCWGPPVCWGPGGWEQLVLQESPVRRRPPGTYVSGKIHCVGCERRQGPGGSAGRQRRAAGGEQPCTGLSVPKGTQEQPCLPSKSGPSMSFFLSMWGS